MPVMIIGGELFCHSEGDEGVLCGALERTQREGIPPWRVPGVGLCLLSAEGRVTPLAALLKRPPPGCVTRYSNGDIKDLRQENLMWFRPSGPLVLWRGYPHQPLPEQELASLTEPDPVDTRHVEPW